MNAQGCVPSAYRNRRRGHHTQQKATVAAPGAELSPPPVRPASAGPSPAREAAAAAAAAASTSVPAASAGAGPPDALSASGPPLRVSLPVSVVPAAPHRAI